MSSLSPSDATAARQALEAGADSCVISVLYPGIRAVAPAAQVRDSRKEPMVSCGLQKFDRATGRTMSDRSRSWAVAKPTSNISRGPQDSLTLDKKLIGSSRICLSISPTLPPVPSPELARRFQFEPTSGSGVRFIGSSSGRAIFVAMQLSSVATHLSLSRRNRVTPQAIRAQAGLRPRTDVSWPWMRNDFSLAPHDLFFQPQAEFGISCALFDRALRKPAEHPAGPRGN